MKYKTLFRLMLKAMGVFLFVQGAIPIANGMVGIVLNMRQFAVMGTNFPTMIGTFLISSLAQVVEMAVGLYLFFGGEWVVSMAIPSNRPYCQECGYDLTGAVRNRCAECDTPFNPEDVQPSSLMHDNHADEE